MALSLKDFVKKNQKVEEPAPEPEHKQEVAPKVTPSTPTKPKLSFQLGQMAPKPESEPESEPEPESTPATPASPDHALSIRPAEPEVTVYPDFRSRLDHLDSLFVEGTGYTSLTIDTARTRIVEAMRELKEDPTLMQIMRDTDIRNIMAFIQHSADSARKNFAEKGKKREAKSKKLNITLDMSSGLGGSPTGIPTDLKSIASMDFSGLAIKKKG